MHTTTRARMGALILILMLGLSVYLFGSDSSSGPNQIVLTLGAAIAAIVALQRGHTWPSVMKAIIAGISTAMGAILKAHPHRVAITRAGRAEVFQKIGGPDTGGVSPAGPHTHVLPKLMASGRTHTANTPIPEGMVPVASLHPGNPVIGALGEDRPFDPDLHERFQALLAVHGLPPLVAVKRAAVAALARGLEASTFAEPGGRHERAALRIALRQQVRLAEARGDTDLARRVADWRAVFDNSRSAEDADDEAPGHEPA